MSDGSPLLVSVVMATNRVSEYLAEALHSVVTQRHQPVEMIIVVNGLPDAEPVMKAVRMIVPEALVLSVPESNVSTARNLGIAHAKGEYVAFLDDDDRWDRDRLALQTAALEAAPHAVAAYCGMRVIDEAGSVLLEADQTQVDRTGIARRTTGIIAPNLLVRRASLDRVGGFHPAFRLAQDLDLVLRLGQLGEFAFVPRGLVDYRAHPGSVTRRHRELVRAIERVLLLHRAAATERGDGELVEALSESLRKNRRFAWWRALRSAKAEVRRGKPGAAAREIAWALRVAPTGLVDGALRHARLGASTERPGAPAG
ncbi:glycosyltransferase [Agromyces bracchium]|uniref:Glycosyltransferase n=2 Tax=Agromyces bracchium TaxID=88376 RepID=A0A6I3M264_9MICO|nr:glycosyltransferase [Agromyces bracchium]